MKKALYPGSFDPATFGHLDIIQRALTICDHLTIGVGENTNKNSLFSVEERIGFLKEMTKKLKNITIAPISGLVVEFAVDQKIDVLIRGIRSFSDFDYEYSMALANRHIANIETVFLIADEKLSHIQSSLIQEIAHFGGPLHDFVPPVVEEALHERSKSP